jgi:LacI family transcriptional regulator
MRTARGNFSFRSGVETTARLLAGPERPTALICANDDMAVGALFTAHKLGLEIPRDLSVTGFDDTPVSEIIWPPLTTVHQPLKLIGARAVEMIVDQINAAKTSATPPAHRYELAPHRVVMRESADALVKS